MPGPRVSHAVMVEKWSGSTVAILKAHLGHMAFELEYITII